MISAWLAPACLTMLLMASCAMRYRAICASAGSRHSPSTLRSTAIPVCAAMPSAQMTEQDAELFLDQPGWTHLEQQAAHLRQRALRQLAQFLQAAQCPRRVTASASGRACAIRFAEKSVCVTESCSS